MEQSRPAGLKGDESMLSANDARGLTQEACGAGNAIFDEMMAEIDRRVKEAAKGGKRELHDPLSQPDTEPMLPPLTADMRRSIQAELVRLGFEWTHHPRPAGSEDPRERDYDTISW
jgi:hypothetical protein